MDWGFHRKFEKDIKTVPRNIQEQFFCLLESFNNSDNKIELTAKKITGHENRYRLRIGNYRIGFSIEREKVLFRRILHRQNIYKKFP